MSDNNKIPVVYILAASHSGSTLLSMLLNAHEDVCTVGELKATSLGDPGQYLCSCRERIMHCPFWKGITEDMKTRGHVFNITNAGTDIRAGAGRYVKKLLRPLHRGPVLESIRDMALWLSPAWRKRLPEIQQLNTHLMASILERTGKKIIVDSSKIGIRLKYLLRNPSLDVKVIRLVRDGRGVVLTYMDPARFADAGDPKLREGGTGGTREHQRLSMEPAAREWRRSNEEAEAVLKTMNPGNWIQINYEELCKNSERVLNQLFSFIGVDPARAIMDFRSVEHHIVGNGMRLDSHSQISLDERWKTTLTMEDLTVFDSVAGDMSRKLGYEKFNG